MRLIFFFVFFVVLWTDGAPVASGTRFQQQERVSRFVRRSVRFQHKSLASVEEEKQNSKKDILETGESSLNSKLERRDLPDVLYTFLGGHNDAFESQRHKLNPSMRSRSINPLIMPETTFKKGAEDFKSARTVYIQTLDAYRKANFSAEEFYVNLLRRKTEALASKSPDGECSLPRVFPNENKAEEIYSDTELSVYLKKLNVDLGTDSERKFMLSSVPNGVPITLEYNNGMLQSASTVLYEEVDLTDVILGMRQIPRYSKDVSNFKVKGRMYLTKNSLEIINRDRVKRGVGEFVDPYQAITMAAIYTEEPIRWLNGGLSCYFDEFLTAQNHGVIEQRSKLKFNGFPVLDRSHVRYSSSQEITNTLKAMSYQSDFELSGVKIALVEPVNYYLLGEKFAIYKYVPNISTAKINAIKFEVLDDGSIVAVVIAHDNFADMSHRFLFGSVTDFDRLNLSLGDDISVVSPNNRSPYIHYSYANGSKEKKGFPTQCPQCDSKVILSVNSDGEKVASCHAHLGCKNYGVEEILRFTNIHGLHVPSLTREIVNELRNRVKAFGPVDLFMLTPADFNSLTGIEEHAYRQVLKEIQTSKLTTLDRLLFALNVPGIPDVYVAERLRDHFPSIDHLYTASTKELRAVPGVDAIMAKNIRKYFSKEDVKSFLKKLVLSGVVLEEPNDEMHTLLNKPDSSVTPEEHKMIESRVQDYNSSFEVSDMEYDHFQEKLDRLSDTISSPKDLFKDPYTMKKTYDINELRSICEKLFNTSPYVVEPKVNGIGCMLRFKNGQLVSAHTKHRKKAQDITPFVKKCTNIPKNLHSSSFSGVVRGEIYISKISLKLANDRRVEEEKSEYVDCLSCVVAYLNTAHTTLRSSDYDLIEFIPYDHYSEEDTKNVDRITLHQWFKKLGFKSSVKSFLKNCTRFQEVFRYIEQVKNSEVNFGVDIDGLVIKPLNDIGVKTFTTYKFNQDIRNVFLESVKFSLTQSGRIVAIAQIAPTRFNSGRELRSLHISDIRSLENVAENSLIRVSFSVGSSPVFKEFIAPKRATTSVIKIPTQCPNCRKKLERVNSMLRCANSRCRSTNMHELLLVAERLGIINKECPKKHIQDLIAQKAILSFGDFYRLIPEEIYASTSLTEQETAILMASIAASLHSPPNSFMRKVMGAACRIPPSHFDKIFQGLDNPLNILNMKYEDFLLLGLSSTTAIKVSNFIKDNKEDCIICLERLNSKQETSALKQAELKRITSSLETKAQHISEQIGALSHGIHEYQTELSHISSMTKKDLKESGALPWFEGESSLKRSNEVLLRALKQYREHQKEIIPTL